MLYETFYRGALVFCISGGIALLASYLFDFINFLIQKDTNIKIYNFIRNTGKACLGAGLSFGLASAIAFFFM